MPYIEALGSDAEDVSDEYMVVNASVVDVVMSPDEDDHMNFIKAKNVFALEQVYADTLINNKIEMVTVAFPCTVQSDTYLIGKDGFDLKDYEYRGLPKDNRCLILFDMANIGRIKHIKECTQEGIFFVEDVVFDEIEEALSM
jgi:hypothetical protein